LHEIKRYEFGTASNGKNSIPNFTEIQLAILELYGRKCSSWDHRDESTILAKDTTDRKMAQVESQGEAWVGPRPWDQTWWTKPQEQQV
jgi:hypothetical protein